MQDHLHTRGEYKPSSKGLGGIFGITSTHVENTQKQQKAADAGGDHLHTRGEYSKQIPI